MENDHLKKPAVGWGDPAPEPRLAVEAHHYNLSTREVETERSLGHIGNQIGELQDSEKD